ncbi:MAG: hypothetical protein L3J06_10770 [Cyclobacteriaceae bacterium]|nr:hypothetical protein [Cyclobacteriaceae bacterium]
MTIRNKFLSAKRKKRGFSTDLPLMSERVEYLLSNPKEGGKLVSAIRASRHGKNKSFSITLPEEEHADIDDVLI